MLRKTTKIIIGIACLLPWTLFADGPSYGLYSHTRTALDPGGTDHYGASAGMDSDTLIVGAPLKNDTFLDSGSAYICSRNQGGPDNWGQVKKLNASDPGNGDQFGYSVDVDGEYAVVGAPFNDDQGLSSGSAYVFKRDQGGANQWGLVAKLTNTTGAAGDEFGFDVAIYSNTVVVGAPLDDDAGSAAGAVHIFDRNTGGSDNWGQVATLTASDPAANDRFGYAVDIDGTDLVAGARDESSTGAIYLFSKSGTWSEVIKKRESGASGGDDFGAAVSIHNGRVLVGAPLDSAGRGSAFIFERNSGGINQWGQVQKMIPSDGAGGDEFGISVALHGSVALIGSHEDHYGAFTDAGSAYLFHRNAGGTGNWGESDKLIGNNGSNNDNMGSSVAMNADTAAAGAPEEDVALSNAGAVYIYDVFFNQTPTINNQILGIAENSSNTTVVGTVIASDLDFGQSLTNSILTDSSSGAFDLNPTNFLLTVLDSGKLDRETVSSIILTVQVVDDGTPPTSDSATITVFINNVIDGAVLTVDKTAPETLSSTSNLSYTIQVDNTGVLASNLVVVDTLPSGVTYNPVGSSGSCVENAGEVTCTVGDLAGTTNLTVNVIVATNTVGIITNVAVASTTTPEDITSNNTEDSAETEVTDFDEDLIPDFFDPDDDNDLIPDDWELLYSLNPTNPADAAMHSDADIFINLEEYIADTDPFNSNSFLKFDVIMGPPLTFGFTSSVDRVYDIEVLTNLPGSAWTPLPGLSNFFGVGGADSRTNLMVQPYEFFRLNVRVPEN